jgi:hypothetical protein
MEKSRKPENRHRFSLRRAPSRNACAEILAVRERIEVEEVVGRVWHERLLADVSRRGTAGRGRAPPNGVHPLDEGGARKPIAAGGSVLGPNHLNLEPSDRIRRHEIGVGGRFQYRTPNGARVPRVFPRGANHALVRRVSFRYAPCAGVAGLTIPPACRTCFRTIRDKLWILKHEIPHMIPVGVACTVWRGRIAQISLFQNFCFICFM